MVQAVTDSSGKEVTAAAIWQLFENEYLSQDGREYQYRGHHLVTATDGTDGELLTLNIVRDGQPMQLTGRGNGPIDALVHALALPFDVLSYEEKSIGKGSEARAAAFVEITTPSRVTLFGVGVHANIITASILAVLSAVRRADARGLLPAAGKAVGAVVSAQQKAAVTRLGDLLAALRYGPTPPTYGMNTRGLPGTFAPMYQERGLRIERASATSATCATQASCGVASVRLDADAGRSRAGAR